MADPLVNAVGDLVIQVVGIKGISLLVVLLVISRVCQLIAKLIPDDATGWKAVVRKVCAVVGLYVSSRITAGVSTADVMREIAPVIQPERREVVTTPPTEETPAPPPVPAFPGLVDKLGKPLCIAALLFVGIPNLSACVESPAVNVGVNLLCENRQKIADVIAVLRKNPDDRIARLTLQGLNTACPFVVRQVQEAQPPATNPAR